MNFTKIGRQRLGMKMPQRRAELGWQSPWLYSLLEAYGIATLALEKFRHASKPNIDLIREYETICNEIEQSFEDSIAMSKPAKL